MNKYIYTLSSFLIILSCTSDGLLVVEPEPPTPRFTLSVTAGAGGTVTPTSGTYDSGSTVILTANANSGFTFNSWSNGSTANPLTILIESNTSISASFTAASYSVNLIPGEGGSVSGGGTYQQGTQVTLTATPNTGYTFTSWSDGSTLQTRTISVSQNLTLTANFTANTYSVTLTANSGGSVSGGGTYQQGTQVTLTATPNAGYEFTSWSDGSTEQSRTISVSQNLTLTVNFEIISVSNTSYSINVLTNSGGSVSGGGSYEQGTQITLTATPNTGYTFTSWSDGSTEQSRTISVSQNLTLTANFEIITYNLILNSGSGGVVSSDGGTFNYGSQVNITATPNIGYTFSSWSDGSTDQSRTISMYQNLTLTANFTANTYSVTLTANSGGSVSGGGTYQQGTQVTLSAIPNSGYEFTSWSDGSTEQSRTISVSQNLTLTANFTANTYSVTLTANSGGSVSGGGSYDQGTQVTLTATPNAGYEFTSWSDGSTEQSRTISVSQNLTLTANFIENSASGSTSGLTTNSGAVNFLAVGSNGTILTSENGETWTSRSNSTVTGNLFGATYGNGVFVITGNDGTYTSSDGISWTRTGVGSRKVLYANGKFVGGPGYSTDGTNWSSGCTGWGIAYGDGKYVYVPYSYTDHTYSTDGVNCQSSNKIPNIDEFGENSGYLWDLAFGNGMFVAAAGNGNSFYVTSPDGINWTPRTFSRSGHRMSTISFVNNKFVGVGGDGSISVSSDGINWTESQVSSDPNKNGTLQSVTYGNGKYVIGGSIRVSSSEFYDGVYISSDLENWTSYNLGASGDLGLYYMIYKN